MDGWNQLEFTSKDPLQISHQNQQHNRHTSAGDQQRHGLPVTMHEAADNSVVFCGTQYAKESVKGLLMSYMNCSLKNLVQNIGP